MAALTGGHFHNQRRIIMLARPTCLHIPALYEEGTARIMWESVDDAQWYELDAHFNETFADALIGKSWSDIYMAGRDWSEIAAGGTSWEDIRSFPATGLRWRNIEFRNRSWDDIIASESSWLDFQTLPVEFTIFRGPEIGRAHV